MASDFPASLRLGYPDFTFIQSKQEINSCKFSKEIWTCEIQEIHQKKNTLPYHLVPNTAFYCPTAQWCTIAQCRVEGTFEVCSPTSPSSVSSKVRSSCSLDPCQVLKTPREVVVYHLTRQSEHLVLIFVSRLILPLCIAVKGLVSVFPRIQPAGTYDASPCPQGEN